MFELNSCYWTIFNAELLIYNFSPDILNFLRCTSNCRGFSSRVTSIAEQCSQKTDHGNDVLRHLDQPYDREVLVQSFIEDTHTRGVLEGIHGPLNLDLGLKQLIDR